MSGDSHGQTFSIDIQTAARVGKEIVGDALEMTNFDSYNMDDFQKTLTGICQTYFPYQLQPALQGFIKVHYNEYTRSVLQDRQAIGDVLQKKVAPGAEAREIINTDLFKQ